jgi:ribosomal protein S27AE
MFGGSAPARRALQAIAARRRPVSGCAMDCAGGNLWDVDLFDDAQQPRCPECGTLMRDVPGGWQCSACGHADYLARDGKMPPAFDGPSVKGG